MDSDISYDLNSHHIDICASMVRDQGFTPVEVSASASKGCAVDSGCDPKTEDTISLLVHWVKKSDATKSATAVYTAS